MKNVNLSEETERKHYGLLNSDLLVTSVFFSDFIWIRLAHIVLAKCGVGNVHCDTILSCGFGEQKLIFYLLWSFFFLWHVCWSSVISNS